MLKWVGEEVLKEYKNLHHNHGLQGHGDRGVHHVGEGSCREAAMDAEEGKASRFLRTITMMTKQGRWPSAPSWPIICTKEATRYPGSRFSRGGRRGKRRSPAALPICRCPLGSSSEVTLWAASCATCPPSGTTTGRAPPTRPTRRRTRRRRVEEACAGQRLGDQGGSVQG